jgi:hypothetical protein
MIHKLHHNLQEPERSINIDPSLVGNSLLSTVEMGKASYTANYDDKEINFYNSVNTKNHGIGRCNPQRIAMLTGQTVVCPPQRHHLQ